MIRQRPVSDFSTLIMIPHSGLWYLPVQIPSETVNGTKQNKTLRKLLNTAMRHKQSKCDLEKH